MDEKTQRNEVSVTDDAYPGSLLSVMRFVSTVARQLLSQHRYSLSEMNISPD